MLQRGVNVAITADGTAPWVPSTCCRRQGWRSSRTAGARTTLPPAARKLLEMITIDAARALGMDKEIGSIEVGKKADIAVVNLRKPHLVPNWMVVHRLIYEAVGQDVDVVIVNGRVLMQDRQLKVGDADMIMDEARRRLVRW